MIAILLSTYNGERYLARQLDSLLNQSSTSFKIFIRDDGSTDKTVSIIKDYQKNNSELIHFFEENQNNLGVRGSFTWLIKNVEAEIYFFCDQDDIWNKNKITTHVEVYNSKEEPTLVASDLSLSNVNDQILFDSYYRLNGIKYNKINLQSIIGLMPGCSYSFNYSLRNLYIKYESLNNLIHDNFLFTINKLFDGKIILLNDILMSYRIHENNTIGVDRRKFSWFYFFMLNEPLKIYIKDIVKFLFFSKEWNVLKYELYFSLIDNLSKDPLLKEKLEENNILNLKEIEQLNVIRRKQYFLKYFTPHRINSFQFLKDLILF